MSKEMLTEELWDSPVQAKEHDRDGLITDEQKWDESVKARYGGDELWASERSNA